MKRFDLICLSGILFLSAFLRFYRLPELFSFGFNEEYQATMAKSIIDNFHIVWVGVSAAHLDFYTGPLFTYFTTFWLALSKGNPLITGYIAALIGVATTYLTYKVGVLVFNKWVGFSASLLYATLPLLAFYDQKYWNPSPLMLFSLLVILAIIKSKQNQWWWVIFFICFGLFFNTQLAAIPIVFVGLFIFFKNIRIIPRKIIICSFLVFVLIYSPLLVFDYYHNFSNLKTPFRLKSIASQVDSSTGFSNHVLVIANSISRVWYLNFRPEVTDESLPTCDPLPFGLGRYNEKYLNERTIPSNLFQILITGLTVIYLGLLIFDKNKKAKLLGISIIALLVCFLFFPGGTFEYYLLPIFPLLLYMPGYLITKSFGFTRLLLILFILIIVSLGTLTVLSAKAEFGLEQKKKLIFQVNEKINGKSFELWERGGCHGFEGWRYLFYEFGENKPIKSSIDRTLGWIYPEQIEDTRADYQVVIVEERFPMNIESLHPLETLSQPLDKKVRPIKIIDQGGFRAYIFDIRQTGSVWD